MMEEVVCTLKNMEKLLPGCTASKAVLPEENESTSGFWLGHDALVVRYLQEYLLERSWTAGASVKYSSIEVYTCGDSDERLGAPSRTLQE
jgi:hypothetical protein